MQTGSTICLTLFPGVFTQNLKTGSHVVFRNHSMICPGSLSQHVWICCRFVGPLTLQAPPNPVVKPSYFAPAKRFLWFAFPRSCWLISPHWCSAVGRGMRGNMGRIFWFGCGHVMHVERTDYCSCWKMDERPTHCWERMEIWRWHSSQLTHITTSVTALIL